MRACIIDDSSTPRESSTQPLARAFMLSHSHRRPALRQSSLFPPISSFFLVPPRLGDGPGAGRAVRGPAPRLALHGGKGPRQARGAAARLVGGLHVLLAQQSPAADPLRHGPGEPLRPWSGASTSGQLRRDLGAALLLSTRRMCAGRWTWTTSTRAAAVATAAAAAAAAVGRDAGQTIVNGVFVTPPLHLAPRRLLPLRLPLPPRGPPTR